MNPRVSRSSRRSRRRPRGIPSRRSPRSSRSATRSTSSRTTSRSTSAAFEPVIDYVVVKWPRFAFEKFPGADTTLGTQMKSVGEVMSIGRTFCEALQKAARSLETGKDGLVSLLGRVDYRALAEPKQQRDLVDGGARARDAEGAAAADAPTRRARALEKLVAIPTRRPPLLRRRRDARRASPTTSSTRSRRSTPGFSRRCARIVAAEEQLARGEIGARPAPRGYKRLGFSDRQIARARGQLRGRRPRAAQVAGDRAPSTRASTRAPPSSSRTRRTSTRPTRPRARRAPTPAQAQGRHPRRRPEPHRAGDRVRLLLRPRRAWRCASSGFETVMVNCNPETVSTDYDTVRPPLLRAAHARGRARHRRRGEARGRHRAVRRADAAQARGAAREARACTLLGTSADAIDRAEDRGRFDELLTKLALKRPRSGIAHGAEEAFAIAEGIGFPVLVRPSYVLGGRAMMIAYARERARALRRARRRGGARGGHADDPRRRVPEGRHRGRRRLRRRRQARRHRRRDAAHRGGRASTRATRSSVLPPHSLSPEIVAQHRGADAHARPRARRRRPDERAVRGEGRRGLHPRGEPAREPHGAVRLEGDGAPAREDRRAS